MSGVAIGVGVVGAAAGIGGSMLSASAQKDAAKQAAAAQAKAAAGATQSIQGGFEEAVFRGTPYEGLGQEGAYRLASALGGKEYTYSDPNYEIMPQTEAMKYRTPELMAAGSESLLKQLEQMVQTGKGQTPFFNNKYKGDIPVAQIYKDAMDAIRSGQTPEQAFKSLTYGDHNVGAAVTNGLMNYQKDPSKGFVIPGYRTSINVTEDTKNIFDPNDTTKNVYRNRITGEVTTNPSMTTVNEKGFDEAALPTTFQQDNTLAEYNPYDYKDQAVPTYKGMTQEDFDREVTNRDIQTDPAFQWKQDKMNRELNAQLSARGKYFNPRVTEAALGESNMRLVSDEYDKGYARNLNRFGQIVGLGKDQYGADIQGYGLNRTQSDDAYKRSLTDFGLRRQNEADAYQRYLDAYKAQMGEYGLQTDANTRRYQRLLDLTKIGQGQAGQAGNWSTSTGSNIANITTGLGNAQANAATQVGQANANMWGGIAAAIPAGVNAGINAYGTFDKSPTTYKPGQDNSGMSNADLNSMIANL